MIDIKIIEIYLINNLRKNIFDSDQELSQEKSYFVIPAMQNGIWLFSMYVCVEMNGTKKMAIMQR